MPFYKGEPLSKYISQHLVFSVSQTLTLMRLLIEKLQGLHEAGYLHNDLYPSNILVDLNEPMQVNLVDYGATRKINTPYLGITHHRPPEFILSTRKPRTPESELYNLGCTLHEVSLRTAYSDYDIIHQFIHLTLQMQNSDPDERPTLEQIHRQINVWQQEIDTRQASRLGICI
jgi:serine/threonine protein kinase